MAVVVVAVLSLLVGVALIGLLGRFSDRTAERHAEPACDALADRLTSALSPLGFTLESRADTRRGVDLVLVDARPLVGGRILVRAVVEEATPLEVGTVLSFVDVVRSEPGVLKGILVALSGFSREARLAVESATTRVELVDAAALRALEIRVQ